MNLPEHFSHRRRAERETLREAADWLSRRDAGWAPGDEAGFRAWLAAAARHPGAAEEIEAAWAVLTHPRGASQIEIVRREIARRRQRRARRRKVGTVVAAFFAAAAAVALVFLPAAPPGSARGLAVGSTIAPRPERRTLSDGSVVELKPGAAIAVAFSPDRRAVRLIRGEALFAVAKNPARPFVVSAGGVEVRAVGTEFAVGFAPEKIGVLVTEGRVRVARTAGRGARADAAKPDNAAIFVDAGNRVLVPAGASAAGPWRAEPVSAAEIARALAWRGLRVEFSATPLAEAIQLFNRQNRVQLSLGEQSIGGLRITGVFSADDPAGFSRLLEDTLNLRAVRVGDGQIVLLR